MIIDHNDDERLVEQFFNCDYQDRGMLKWAGYFLSDHTSALQQMFIDEQPEEILPRQEMEEVSKTLANAWHRNEMVHVQLNELQQGELIESVTGQVLGVYDDKIIIQNADDRYTRLDLEEIRNVRVV